MPTYEIGKLRLVFEMDDLVSAKKDKLIQNFKKLDGAVNQSADKMQAAGKSTGMLGNAMSRLRFVIDPVYYAMNLLRKTVVETIDTAAKFEQAIHNVGAVAGATTDELNQLADAAKVPEIAELGFNALNAAESLYIFASAGLSVEESISALEGTLTLAAATQYDLNDVTKTMISTIKQFGLEADETGRIADVFAGVISDSQATMEKFAKSMQYAGAIANTAGISLEDTATALGLLYNAGMAASMSGTALRRVISGLIKTTKEGTLILAKYGLTYDDLDPKVNSFRDILQKLLPMVDEAGDLMELFGLRGGPAMAAMLGQGVEAFDDLYDSTQQAGVASWQAAMQMDTLQGAVRQTKGELTELYTNIGSYFIPSLKEGANTLYYFVEGLNSLIGAAKESESRIERLDRATEAYVEQLKEQYDWTYREADALDTTANNYARAKARVEELENEIDKAHTMASTKLLSAMAEFGALGGVIGSVVPVIGTSIGAGLGAMGGAIVNILARMGFLKDKTEELNDELKNESDYLKALEIDMLNVDKAQQSVIGTTMDWRDVVSEVSDAADRLGTTEDIIWSKTEELGISFQKLSETATYFGSSAEGVTSELIKFYDFVDGTTHRLVDSNGKIDESIMKWYAFADSIFTTDNRLANFIYDTLEKMILEDAEAQFKSFTLTLEDYRKISDNIAAAEEARDKATIQAIEDDRRMAEMLGLVKLSGESLIDLFGTQWGATFLGAAMSTGEFDKTLQGMKNSILENIQATEDLYDEMQDLQSGTANFTEQQRMASIEGQRLFGMFRAGTITITQLKEAMELIGELDLSTALKQVLGESQGIFDSAFTGIERDMSSHGEKFRELLVDPVREWGDVGEIAGGELSTRLLRQLETFKEENSAVWGEIASRTEEELAAIDWKTVVKLYEEGGGDSALAYLKGFMDEWKASDLMEQWEADLAGFMATPLSAAPIWDESLQTLTVFREGVCGEFEEIYECVDGQLQRVKETVEQSFEEMWEEELRTLTATPMAGPAVWDELAETLTVTRKSICGEFEQLYKCVDGQLELVRNEVEDTIDYIGDMQDAIDAISDNTVENASIIQRQINSLNVLIGQFEEAWYIGMGQGQDALEAYVDANKQLLEWMGISEEIFDQMTLAQQLGFIEAAMGSLENEVNDLNQALQDLAEETSSTWDDIWREMNRTTITNIQQMGDQWIVSKENICGTWQEVYECIDGSLQQISGSVTKTLDDIWREMTATSIVAIEEIEGGVRLIKEGYCGTFEEVYECIDGQLQKITDSTDGATQSWEEDLQEIVNIINALAGEELIEFEDVFKPATEQAKELQELLLQLQRDLAAGAVTELHVGTGVTPEMEGFIGDVGAGLMPPELTSPYTGMSGNTYVTYNINEGAIVIQGDVSDPQAAKSTLEVALEQIAIEAESEAEWGVP